MNPFTMKKTTELIWMILACLVLTACTETTSEPEVTAVAETVSDKTAEKTPAQDGIDQPLEFQLTNLDGETVQASDYRGQWLVINYWATWCAPCRDEMPELVKFQAENDQVQILGIAYEDAEVAKLKNFAKDFNINYPLLTIDVYNPPAFAEEGGLGLPTTIVYDPQGMRHNKHMGPIDAAGLQALIE